jgi:hypothetical protein
LDRSNKQVAQVFALVARAELLNESQHARFLGAELRLTGRAELFSL